MDDCSSLARVDHPGQRRCLRDVARAGGVAAAEAGTGYRGGYVLRRQTAADEVEFLVVNLFESIEAVKRFAGPDYEVAVFEPEARRLLAKVEVLAAHYDVRAASIRAMSIFFIVIIASNARFAAAVLESLIASANTRGTICQLNPNLSLHQPQTLSCPPPRTIAFQ